MKDYKVWVVIFSISVIINCFVDIVIFSQDVKWIENIVIALVWNTLSYIVMYKK